MNLQKRLFCLFLLFPLFSIRLSYAQSQDPLVLSAEVKREYLHEEPFSVGLTFTNTSKQPVKMILPAGNDYQSMFSYEVTEIPSGKVCKLVQRSPQSFAADWERTIPAGGKLKTGQSWLEPEDEDQCKFRWLSPGRYRLVAIFDERRTRDPKLGTSRVLQSQPVEFRISKKRFVPKKGYRVIP